MQTSFTLAQLADPQVFESERILRACVHCGFCTATCPTYVLLGDELDSPRGRIYLIKEMLEHDRPATPEVVKHIDRCLSCLACMTTCPSGVHYMHLVDHAREHIEKTYRRPLLDRLLRATLARVLPYPPRLRAALRAGLLARPLAPLFAKIHLPTIAAMLRLIPSRLPEQEPTKGQRHVWPAQGMLKGRVALLSVCANQVLAPAIDRAAINVLTRHKIEVVVPAKQGCCGALVHHLGRNEEALDQVRVAVDALSREFEEERLDAIVVTASGCGTMLKDYGFLLRNDAAYAEKAAKVSALAKDISEYLNTLSLARAHDVGGMVVAYHSACSLQHGQRIVREPKDLLSKLGYTVKDVPEAHLCCGSAGTYNILQPEIAGRLRDRKVANIERLKPEAIAAGNIGCITQIAAGTAIPILHPVELVDWATGGPMPAALQEGEYSRGRLASFSTLSNAD
jgi:glycolate oxidase iron-sulfur subunit